MPQKPITSSQPQTSADGHCQNRTAGTKPSTDWITTIQNMMTITRSVRVSDFTRITDIA